VRLRLRIFTFLDAVAGASLAFAAGVWLTGWNMDLLTNADALFLPALFEDLDVGGLGVLRTWHFGSSTFLFPDVALFAATWALTPHYAKVIPAYAGLISTASVFAVWAVFRRAKPMSIAVFSATFVSGIAFVFALLSVLTSTHVLRKWWDSFVVPAHHYGNVVTTLLGFAIYLWWRDGRTSTRRLALLAFTTAAGVLSDLLFTLTFVAPVLAVDLLLSWSVPRKSRWTPLLLPSVLGAASLLGSGLDALMNPLSPLRGAGQKIGAFASIWGFVAARLESREERLGTLVRATLVVWAVVVAIRAPRGNAAADRTSSFSRWAVAHWLIIASIASSVLGATLSGKYHDGTSDRYILAFGFFPLFGIFGYYAARIAEAFTPKRMTSLSLLMLGIVTGGVALHGNWIEAAKPQFVHCVENLGLSGTAGLAPYWLAKPLIVFSQRRIQAVQVTASGEPYGNVSNDRWTSEDWFGGAPEPQVRFALMAGDATQRKMLDGTVAFQDNGHALEPSAIRRLLGEPQEVRHCEGGATVWLYKAKAVEGRLPLPSGGLVRFPLRLRADHGQLRYGPAAEIVNDQVRSNGHAGIVLFGPYLAVPAGEYRIRWFGRALGPSGTAAFEVAIGGAGLEKQAVELRDVSESHSELAVLDFELPRPARDLETRVFSHGGARFQLDEILIERR
jgi:hypothetical protein